MGVERVCEIHFREGKLTIATHKSDSIKAAPKRTSKPAKPAATDVLERVLASLDDAKAEEIVSIDIQGKSALGDYMVVASGRSHRHVSAIADQLLREFKNAGLGTPKVEGKENADWILIDTGDVIIHLFRPEVREFYGIEKMWQMPEMHEVN